MTDEADGVADEILVVECQCGSTSAFEALVLRWQERLWRYAARLTHDSEAAWEVSQASWLGIVRGIHALENPATFRAWAFRIVSNQAITWLKRKGKERAFASDLLDGQQAASLPSSAELSSDVREVLRRLPTRYGEMLMLHYLEGLSVGEIADSLEVRPGTVKSRLHMARAKFKSLWESLGKG